MRLLKRGFVLVLVFSSLTATAFLWSGTTSTAQNRTAVTTLKCLRCKADMERGYLVDNRGSLIGWAAGKASGWNASPSEKWPLITYHCTKCGYLESYAK